MPPYERVDSPDETTIFEYHDLEQPTTADIYRARNVVREHLPRTPLVRSDTLSEHFSADVYLKREDTLPTGAFKVRGGVHLAATLPEEFHEPGLAAASTGNHGQSVAYAGRLLDVPVLVGVPEDANPEKVAAMERLGARVEHHGADFDDAREYVEQLAVEEGYRYVHSANEPKLIAGVGTAGLEVVEDLPDVEYLFCPVGGGSSASGYCLTVGELADSKVIGVQSAAAPAAYEAWRDGHLDGHDRMETFAEGLATRTPFALSQRVMRERLDDMLLAEDSDLRRWVRRLFADEHIVAEGASAAAFAGLEQMANEVSGSTVVIPISGRNVDPEKLLAIVGDGG